MSDERKYEPGKFHSLGYAARKNGKGRDTIIENRWRSEVEEEEWMAGWHDAHSEILDAARAKVGQDRVDPDLNLRLTRALNIAVAYINEVVGYARNEISTAPPPTIDSIVQGARVAKSQVELALGVDGGQMVDKPAVG